MMMSCLLLQPSGATVTQLSVVMGCTGSVAVVTAAVFRCDPLAEINSCKTQTQHCVLKHLSVIKCVCV